MAKIKPRRPELNDSLQITSMMDAFTIILVFLLKSYSTEAIAVQPSDQLQLPWADASVTPEPEVKITVSNCLEDDWQYVPPKCKQAAQDGEENKVCAEAPCHAILVDNPGDTVPKAPVKFFSGKVAGQVAFSEGDNQGFNVPALRSELVAFKKKSQDIQTALAGVEKYEWTGRILILADESLPFDILKAVIYTVGQAEFEEIRFVTRKPK